MSFWKSTTLIGVVVKCDRGIGEVDDLLRARVAGDSCAEPEPFLGRQIGHRITTASLCAERCRGQSPRPKRRAPAASRDETKALGVLGASCGLGATRLAAAAGSDEQRQRDHRANRRFRFPSKAAASDGLFEPPQSAPMDEKRQREKWSGAAARLGSSFAWIGALCPRAAPFSAVGYVLSRSQPCKSGRTVC